MAYSKTDARRLEVTPARRLALAGARKAGELCGLIESKIGRPAVNVAVIGGGIWLAGISAAALLPILAGFLLALVGFLAGVGITLAGLSSLNGKGIIYEQTDDSAPERKP